MCHSSTLFTNASSLVASSLPLPFTDSSIHIGITAQVEQSSSFIHFFSSQKPQEFTLTNSKLGVKPVSRAEGFIPSGSERIMGKNK